jgi:hypothetical protein
MKKAIVIAVLIITAVLSSNAQTKKVLFVMSAEDTLLLNKGTKGKTNRCFPKRILSWLIKQLINRGFCC